MSANSSLSAASSSADGASLHPQHEPAVDEAHRVVVGVEAHDLVDGHLDVVGGAEQREVVVADVARVEQLLGDERLPGVPVRAARNVEQHDRGRLCLARLQQGEQLERLVERAEATREQDERVRLLHELELAGEEVAEVHELRVAVEELRRRPLERQLDAHAEGLFGTGALDARFHDPGAGAGHDHPVACGDRGGELSGLHVQGIVGLGACRAEDRDLARGAVRARTR